MTALDRLRADLAGLTLADDAPTLRMASRDFFWFSPVLKPELEGKVADLVVTPASKDELRRVAAACARHRVPLVIRGGGTGNYGQAVPLAGGVVVDMRKLDRKIFARPGGCRFEAGANMLDMDKMLDADGQELRFHPSTRAQATIGGFVAGGAAGVGSCTWGQIDNLGAVTALEVMTVEEEPRLIELRGREILKVMHAYGVNGIITEVELPTAPAHDWAERIVTFDSFMAAVRFGQAFMECEGIAKKLASVHDARIGPYLKRLAPYLPEGRAFAILMVSEPQADTLDLLIADHKGEVTFRRGAAEAKAVAFGTHHGRGGPGPLYEYTWNHTTLHALKMDPAITYIQLRFPAPNNVALVEWTAKEFDEDVLLHLEFQRREGKVITSSLALVKYTTTERLNAIMARATEGGVQSSNAHTYVLNNAGWKRIDAPQPEFKRLADPFGLMNPGKLVGWEAASQAAE
ncbi:FAD-binding oxidoreductase [Phreatobacter oligotrophus]|uniref:FAD-binding oxidoreductase n=1 Tax=Phreatobacter oligotrophus TaxID=1122261 RepID=UPI0023546C37|nr:FAD-binding oxidoreductase [Phreatobacter oligotrophus]MBX9992413.1 FAD-binding oxidoreductase [Phreatobacter oligotrophus]